MTHHDFQNLPLKKKKKTDTENYLFALVGRRLSNRGKEVAGNWPVSQVMGGLATLAGHRWGPAEERPVTGVPCSTGTASLPQSIPTEGPGRPRREGATGMSDHTGQETHTDEPSTQGTSASTCLGYSPPPGRERPGGNYFKLKFNQPHKSQPSPRQQGGSEELRRARRSEWKPPGGGRLPFLAWLLRLLPPGASLTCFRSP